jgi:hypothetical protein
MRWDSVHYVGDPDDDDARFEHAAKTQRKYSKQELMFDWDPFHNTIEEYTHYDGDTGTMTYRRTQWCQQTLDDNAEWRAAEQNWRQKEDKWVRFASIPTGVVELWMVKYGVNVLLAETDRNGVPNEHMRGCLRLLRDPEWEYLKTTDMDMGDGKAWGNYRLTHVPGNGLIWPTKDGL